MGSHAHKTKNPELESKVDVTLAGLARLDNVRFLDVADRIVELSQTHAEALQNFRVKKETIERVAKNVQEFHKGSSQPRQAIAGRVVQTKALPALVRATTEMLRGDLDRQMNMFRRDEPEFYAAYRSARTIVNNSMNTGPRTPEGEETEAAKDGTESGLAA